MPCVPLQCCCYTGGAGIVTYQPTDTCTCARKVESSQIWATVILRCGRHVCWREGFVGWGRIRASWCAADVCCCS